MTPNERKNDEERGDEEQDEKVFNYENNIISM